MIQKKKVAIVTLTHVQNYGNRLQNYALQQVLTSLGADVETIFNDIPSRKKRIVRCVKRRFKKVTGLNYSCMDERVDRFDEFNRKFINASKFRADNCSVSKMINDHYDCFFAGSDQIWNCNYHFSPYFFLQFADKPKRYTYAASFGISDIKSDKIEQYAEWMRQLVCVSVREKNAVELVQRVAGVGARWDLDPTLLLEAEKWREIQCIPCGMYECEEEFVVVYFLGGIPDEVQKKIEGEMRIGVRIVYLEGDTMAYSSIIDQKTYAFNPSEFIWLIDNCKYILTDSYHGTIFSIIFRKKFVAFSRMEDIKGNNMDSRIEGLLYMLDLEGRFNSLNIDDEIPIDYDHIKEILDKKKIDSISYLAKCIS